MEAIKPYHERGPIDAVVEVLADALIEIACRRFEDRGDEVPHLTSATNRASMVNAKGDAP
jgi:hypothetical protein